MAERSSEGQTPALLPDLRMQMNALQVDPQIWKGLRHNADTRVQDSQLRRSEGGHACHSERSLPCWLSGSPPCWWSGSPFGS